jgi:hypothetical protein
MKISTIALIASVGIMTGVPALALGADGGDRTFARMMEHTERAMAAYRAKQAELERQKQKSNEGSALVLPVIYVDG